MIWKGREAVFVLCNIDKENKGYTYTSQWFNVFCTRLETCGES